MANNQRRLLLRNMIRWKRETIKQRGIAFCELTRAARVRRSLFMRWKQRLA